MVYKYSIDTVFTHTLVTLFSRGRVSNKSIINQYSRPDRHSTGARDDGRRGQVHEQFHHTVLHGEGLW